MLNHKQSSLEYLHKFVQIIHRDNWLIVELSQPMQVLSWGVVGGGKTLARRVVWRRVSDTELNCPVDPSAFLIEKLKEENLNDAIGLLTSARLDDYAYIKRNFGSYHAECVATVGMGNALCVSDPPTAPNHIGTINLFCQVSVPLSETAFLEAISIITEARTLAVLESGILSSHTQLPATGTGTDCIVVAAPDVADGRKYAGKHTVIGHLIGSSVLGAVRLGIQQWKTNKATKL